MTSSRLSPFLLCICLSFCTLEATAQTKGRTTKKSLMEEVQRLRLQVDSLNGVLSTFTPAEADTTYIEEELGEEPPVWPGELDTLDREARLSRFYNRQFYNFPDTVDFARLDTLTLTSDLPDSVYIRRLEKMNSFIKLPYNSIVRNFIVYYSQKMSERAPVIVGLAQYYMPIFEEIFDSMGLPVELKAMAIIESALNPRAVSRAKATGMWQFMYRTALSYKLTINSYVDERMDPVASAYAAAAYLKDAYDIFGDWNLAIASYNCGSGNVNKAIRRAGGSTDIWDIYPFLPRETRGYVPSFTAALYLLEYYPEHQIKPVPPKMPAYVDTFEVNKMLHFEQIHALTQIPMDELRDLNPQYKMDIVPGVERTYILRLPHQYSGLFAEKEKEIYAYKDSVYFSLQAVKQAASAPTTLTHKVRRGETLGGIALKYGVSVANLKQWNGLRSNTIRVNQYLTVYSGKAPVSASSKTTSSSAYVSQPSGSYTTHTVQKNETLGKIAARYKVGLSQLKSWNNLRSDNIQIGQKLKIYGAGGPSASTAGAATYTVRSGDTLWEIAQKNGISLNTLYKLNGLNKNSKIRPGQKLKLR